MHDLLDITDRVLPVAVVGSGVIDPVDACTDGRQFYLCDAGAARVGAHPTGRLDLAGRPVRVKCGQIGWTEHRGAAIRQLHQRHLGGRRVFWFHPEWLLTVGNARAQTFGPR